MSLNWNVAKVANSETVCFYIAEEDDAGRGISKGDKLLQGRTEALIFATMVVGMGQITEANHREFFTRVAMYERLNGAYRIRYSAPGVKEGVFFTLADIRDHIGLTTNVSKESPAAWLKRTAENFARETLYQAKRAEEREAAEAAKA